MTHENDKYDFGPDADVIPENDPRFDVWIAKAAPTLNAPGSIPREQMWDAIRAAQRTASDAAAGVIPGVRPLRRTHWRLMSVVIAASLLLGVAIDRVALRPRMEPRATSTPVASAPPDTTAATRLYRMAAGQTMTQAEALLTMYRAGSSTQLDSEAARQLGGWGRDVLTSTRLLLDSPAGKDPHLRSVLEDLELVLVQIIRLSGAPLDATERTLIDRALRERDLLPRIRTAVPAGVVDAASSE